MRMPKPPKTTDLTRRYWYILPSFRRKPESMLEEKWMPAFAGMTKLYHHPLDTSHPEHPSATPNPKRSFETPRTPHNTLRPRHLAEMHYLMRQVPGSLRT